MNWPTAHHTESAIIDLAVSNNGQLIATASRDHTVRMLDAGSLQELRSFARPDSPFKVWFIDHDERLLVRGNAVTSVVHSRTGQDLMRIPQIGSASKVSPDGRWLATLDGKFVRWRRSNKISHA